MAEAGLTAQSGHNALSPGGLPSGRRSELARMLPLFVDPSLLGCSLRRSKTSEQARIYKARRERRCRTASNKVTPVATETLRLSISPGSGILTSPSQCSRVSRRMPSLCHPAAAPRCRASRPNTTRLPVRRPTRRSTRPVFAGRAGTCKVGHREDRQSVASGALWPCTGLKESPPVSGVCRHNPSSKPIPFRYFVRIRRG